MTQTILTLDTYLEHMGKEIGYSTDKISLSFVNVDVVFMVFVRKGVKKVKVTREQMMLITRFSLVNYSRECPHGHLYKAILRGKTDIFYGVKLILYERDNQDS